MTGEATSRLEERVDALVTEAAANRAILSAMQEAIRGLARAVESLIRVESKQVDHSSKLDDHETRMRKVEQRMPGLVEMRSWVIGAAVLVVSALLAAVLTGHVMVVAR